MESLLSIDVEVVARLSALNVYDYMYVYCNHVLFATPYGIHVVF